MGKSNINKTRYGIGEWYGTTLKKLSSDTRKKYAELKGVKNLPCPFQQSGNLCNKAGGVCSLAKYELITSKEVKLDGTQSFVTTCPNRFLENNTIFKEVGKTILGSNSLSVIKEVPFLKGVDSKGNKLTSTVGRIDMILAKTERSKILDWCALEIQAVYFSGTSMKRDFEKIAKNPSTLQFPSGNRRPDYRSSGPKRLMPQLQIKVPSLRRWGKKIAIIIDKSFYGSIAPMEEINHMTNADIVWFIVDYRGKNNELKIVDTIYTTLESSVNGLTAGIPISKDDFEERLFRSIKKGGKKVVNL
jgi:hypothetical protein